MEFDLDADQVALAGTVRRFCADRFPLAAVRTAGETGGVIPGSWRELADLGVFGLTAAEAEGGAGLRPIDAVVVFEELGRALVPGPLTASFLAAGSVDGVIGGDVVATLVEPAAGRPLVVEHLGGSDVVLVLDDTGVAAVPAGEVDAEPVLEPLDPTTPLWLADGLPPGEPVGGPDLAARWRRSGSLLTSALLVGIAEATTTLATDYARVREQFGRVIGSFQAVKHILADMFTRTEVARAAVHAAGVTGDTPGGGDAERAVAAARTLAGRAAIDNAKACVQIHGGVGFTWEADPHLFLKRAWLHDTQYGSVDDAAEVVAQRLTAAASPWA